MIGTYKIDYILESSPTCLEVYVKGLVDDTNTLILPFSFNSINSYTITLKKGCGCDVDPDTLSPLSLDLVDNGDGSFSTTTPTVDGGFVLNSHNLGITDPLIQDNIPLSDGIYEVEIEIEYTFTVEGEEVEGTSTFNQCKCLWVDCNSRCKALTAIVKNEENRDLASEINITYLGINEAANCGNCSLACDLYDYFIRLVNKCPSCPCS